MNLPGDLHSSGTVSGPGAGPEPGKDASGTSSAQRGRGARRRRRWIALAAAAVVALAVGVTVVVTTTGGGSDATPGVLRLTAQDGLVVATGRDFPASTNVQVSARLAHGSGATLVTTDGAGGFRVAFRPAAGVTGKVEISAAAGAHRAQQTVDLTPSLAARPGQQAAPPSGTTVVPMTGAPVLGSPAPDTSGLPEHRVPSDIRADCSTDVTGALNGWLRGVPDNSRIVFPAGACYRVDGSITLNSRNNLDIEGNGATFQAQTQVPNHSTERAQWRLDYGSRITLRDMTLVGVNPAARFVVDKEFDHNVFIRGTHTVTIENIHGRNVYGDFISIAQGVDETTIPSDITIRNVSADTVGRNAIACVACDGVSVTNSVFNNVALHVFDLEIEGDGRPGRNVTFSDNTVEKHGWAAFSVGTPFQTYDNDLSNVSITGNTMTEPGSGDDCLPAISFLYSKIPAKNVVIQKNALVSRTDAVMVKLATGVTIRDNTARLVQPACGHPVGVRTQQVGQADVADNQVDGYRTAYQAQ